MKFSLRISLVNVNNSAETKFEPGESREQFEKNFKKSPKNKKIQIPKAFLIL